MTKVPRAFEPLESQPIQHNYSTFNIYSDPSFEVSNWIVLLSQKLNYAHFVFKRIS